MRRKMTSDFRFFRFTVRKNFVEEPLCAVFKNLPGGEKVYG